MGNILDIEDVRDSYTFFFRNGEESEKFFCKCGKDFEVKAPKEEVDEEEEDLDDDFMVALNSVKLSLRKNIKCPHCDTNYKIPKNQKKLKVVDKFFMSGYHLEKSEDKLTIKSIRVMPVRAGDDIDFVEKYKQISYDIKSKELMFRDFDGNEVEFDLDEIIKYVDVFFDNDTTLTVNMFDIHQYIIELSTHVSDSENIDTIKGLLEETRARVGNDGEVFKKVFTILYSIIKYSNLSTIAMTKSPTFLYEMIRECNPPKSEVLREAKITSPIKIFNFLAENYAKKINEEITEEKIESQEFTFSSNVIMEDSDDHTNRVSSTFSIDSGDNENVKEGKLTIKKGEQRELKINVKSIDNYSAGKVSTSASGNIEVFQIEGDVQISKFIYKRLRNFHDYKQLIRYMKVLEYKELVELMTKFDYDLMVNMIDAVYYRDGIEIEEIKRLIPLFVDFCHKMTKDALIKTKVYDENVEIDLNYNYISDFNFEFYDDSLMMIKTLEFDARKDFYKIKSNDDLKVYHDAICQFYSAIQLEEDGGYQDYFERFKFLEDRKNYDGPLSFEIIDTPKAVVAEGREMHHSAGSYASRLLDGKIILLRVYDDSEDLEDSELIRFTMGLNFNESKGLTFDQLKSYANRAGSNRTKKLVKEWLSCKGVDFNENKPDIKIIG